MLERTSAASHVYTVGILGAGNIVSNMHLPTLLAMPEIEVRWVVDKDLQRASQLGSSFGVPAMPPPKDPTQLPPVDVVLIAIPYGAREPYYEAFRQGTMALYVEKPLARTVEQHRRYSEWFGETRLAVGFQRRAWGSAKLVQQVLASGALGRLRRVLVQHGRPGQLTGSSYSGDFRLAGGGMLFEVGIHWIDLALSIADVQAVRLVRGRMLRHEQFDIHTEALFTAETPTSGEIRLELLISGLAETRNVLQFVGENAALVLHQGDGRVTLEQANRSLEVELTSRLQAHPSTPFQLCHAAWSGLLKGLHTGVTNWTTASSSLLTTQVVEAAYGLPG